MTPSTIVLPSGTTEQIGLMDIDPQDALLWRAYKRLLQRYHLREALYCNDCWDGSRADGCEAHVTDTDILIRCRCKMRTTRGPSA